MNKFAFFLATFAILLAAPGFAQKSPKFGHINSAELLSLMPERKAAMAKMDSVTKEAEKLLQEMMTEYRTEQDKYTAESGKMSELAKKTAEEKLTGLGTRIQNFQQQAQEKSGDGVSLPGPRTGFYEVGSFKRSFQRIKDVVVIGHWSVVRGPSSSVTASPSLVHGGP